MTAVALLRAGHAELASAASHRVLFLADHLGPDDGGRSGVHGVTTYLLDVLPALKALGNEVGACFLRHANPAAEPLRARGIHVSFLETSRFDPFVIGKVDELVREHEYGILHCTQFRASLAGRLVARLNPNVKTVLHVHDLNMPPAPVRWLNRVLSSHEDLAVCVSKAAGAVAVHGYHVSPDRVRVLHTGIDCDAFKPIDDHERALVRRKLDIPQKAPVLCLVARFDRVKGHREMIGMFQELVRRQPDAVLVLVGDGPDRATCERLIADLELGARVRLLGVRQDVAYWLAAADVAVVPSKSEGLCRAAIEANLCGLAAVAFDVGGVCEALPDSICGELVPPDDQAGFVAAIERALKRSAFPQRDLRSRLARERFGLTEHARALASCYTQLHPSSP